MTAVDGACCNRQKRHAAFCLQTFALARWTTAHIVTGNDVNNSFFRSVANRVYAYVVSRVYVAIPR